MKEMVKAVAWSNNFSAYNGMSSMDNRAFSQGGREMRRGRIRLETGGVALLGKQQNEQKEAGRENKFTGEKKRGGKKK